MKRPTKLRTVLTALARVRNHLTWKPVLSSLLILLLVNQTPPALASSPPAGTTIGNQASATYTDSSGTARSATSNVATTTVQQVASFTLTQDNNRQVAVGSQVTFPHTLVNTGNGTDSFTLSTSTSGASLGAVLIFADANGDGIPDNATPITNTGSLPAGGVFKFVVVGTVLNTATAGQSSSVTVTARSDFNNTVTASNTDTTTVSVFGIVNVVKTIDLGTGNSPSGPRTYTLTYNNIGIASVTNLTLMDVIPSGMTYVAGSARWSVSGTTALTDAAGGDPSGVSYDFAVTQAGRVTAVIASVAPGQSGTLTFQVNVNSGLAPGLINNTATYTYNDGSGTVLGPFNSNTALFLVNQVSAITFTGSTVAAANQGGTVVFTNALLNAGNGSDTFEIALGTSTFPAGTTLALFQSDGISPLFDSNGNGTPDTGPVAAGATYNVILKATLPPSISSGGPFTVQKTATSKNDPTKTGIATDTLTAITGNSVDLTNDSAGGSAPGAGAGPEASPVRTVAANPGATARFTLYVNNTSPVPDTYNLSASTNSVFATVALPAGWTVSFKDASEAVITATGVLPGGSNKLVYADIAVPAGSLPATVDVFFRAQSPTTGAADRKHDAVTVNTVRSLLIQPNNSGQVAAGGAVVYSHTLVNNGNVIEGDGTTSTVLLSLGNLASGFNSVVYWDKNNDGVLDVNDPVVSNLAALTGGTGGASTAAGLAVGESARVFVKVFANAGTAVGAVDGTTLTATTSGGVGTVPPAVSVTDTTTVISGQLQLLKEQALDAANDGTPDTAYGTAPLSSGAVSGAGIRYRITVTNNGATPATAVVVSDSIPTFTTYTTVVPAASTLGTVTSAPANGARGVITVNLGTLNPGQSAVITFGVRID